MVTISVYNAFATDMISEGWIERLGEQHLGTYGSLARAQQAIAELHDMTDYDITVDPEGWQEVEPGVWHLDCYEADTGNQLAGFYTIKRADVDV